MRPTAVSKALFWGSVDLAGNQTNSADQIAAFWFWSSVDLTGNHATVPLPCRVLSRTVRSVGLIVRPSPLDVRFGPCGPVARQCPTGVRFGLLGVFRHEKSRPWAAVRYDEIRWKLFDSPIETCSSRLFFYRLERPVVPQHPHFSDSIPLHVLAYPRFGLAVGDRLVLADVEDGEPHSALVGHGLHVRLERVLRFRRVHGLDFDACGQVGAAYGRFPCAFVFFRCTSSSQNSVL